ncbi:MAG: TAT-variant-translocated molybdopterin oxidoreductase [Planctomycetota bacterium]
MPSLDESVPKNNACGSPACGCTAASLATPTTPAASTNTGIAPALTPDFWRSLDEVDGTPEFRQFLNGEFPFHTEESLERDSRRHFLKLMGASMAMAGAVSMSGCLRWPEQKLLPYTSRPLGRLPGDSTEYATHIEIGGVAAGLLVTSYDGRPIKIEGNPEHPANLGSSSSLQQATVLGLYDPARSQAVLNGVSKKSWTDAAKVFDAIRATGGGTLRVLSEASSSESVAAVRRQLATDLPKFKPEQWHVYEPLGGDNEHTGTRLVFGKSYRTHLRFANADVVVSFGDDFLLGHPNAVRYARDFAARRRPANGDLNRLYAIESRYTVTGSMADRRFAVKPSDIVAFAAQLAQELAKRGVALSGIGLAAALPQFKMPSGVESGAIAALADELKKLRDAGKSSVLTAGADQPAALHGLVAVLNAALGNVGKSVGYSAVPSEITHASQVESLRQLTESLTSGQVEYLLILGGNPVYNAPIDSGFAAAIGKATRASIHLSDYVDETSQKTTWHLPRAHALESWGDARSWDGTLTSQQPLIAPLYDGKTPAEVLAMLAAPDAFPRTAYEIARKALLARVGADAAAGENAVNKLIHDGFLAGSAWPQESPALKADALHESLANLAARGAATSERVELSFGADYRVYDGRFSNLGWLQELPDPMTKITWDNALQMSPADAQRRGLKTGSMVRVRRTEGGELDVAVFVMPGQAQGAVTLTHGYGRAPLGGGAHRRVAGAVSYNADLAIGAGFNSFALLRTNDLTTPGQTVELQSLDATHALVTTQNHHPIDADDSLYAPQAETMRRMKQHLRTVTQAQLKADPQAVRKLAHEPKLFSLWNEKDYSTGNKWGMSIDLSACTGCSACVTACQAENNIAVVGKSEVARGREMHWIRIDRYFGTRKEDGVNGYDNPDVLHQPVTCQQCENAPCEQVCPVAATVHSEEGLNDMTYNRCIGTRYCSNNCPYKVRRFNYFNNSKSPTLQEQMVYNPEVTVRARGVMEKCTFCVQRINKVKIKTKNAGVAINDGQITPACAQACPTQAIVFGDLNDPTSRVAKNHADARAYAMLSDLNVKPRNLFLAKVKNPNA